MKLYQYIIILLLIICAMFVAKEITIMFYKCPSCKDDVMESGISFKDNFKTMFNKPSPWQGINQTLLGTKNKDNTEINNNNDNNDNNNDNNKEYDKYDGYDKYDDEYELVNA